MHYLSMLEIGMYALFIHVGDELFIHVEDRYALMYALFIYIEDRYALMYGLFIHVGDRSEVFLQIHCISPHNDRA